MTTSSERPSLEVVAGQKQHVEFHRKVLFRRQLVRTAGPCPGAAYLPFCGDGDLAEACWADRDLWAADLDPARTATFAARFPDAHLATGDCDSWPFTGPTPALTAILDLDAYAYPYHAWRAATGALELAPTVVALFTDGQRQGIKRTGTWRDPDGTPRQAHTTARRFVGASGNSGRIAETEGPDLRVTRPLYNGWLVRACRPWIQGEAHRLGYRLVTARGYTRQDMLYWGAVLKR